MSHLDDEQFALLTVEGPHVLTPEAAAHLETCEQCRHEIEAYLAVGDALRAGVTLERPSEDVWARIAAELDAPGTASGPTAPLGEPDPARDGEPAVAPVLPLRPRATAERRWVRRIAFAAAASFALGAASTVVLNQLISRPSTEIVQSIGLEPLPGWTDEGTATLEVVNGERVLVIDLPETEIDGFREVWLIDRNVERLVSLGTMNGDRAAFPIPDGLDLNDYVVVDVSQEHFDGDPTHSGESIVRGVLS